jgi:FixJ family two-component response regulator
MNSASLSAADSTLARPSQPDPVVFVVDDDISVREALELLIRCTGSRVETFASAEEFLLRERPRTPSCVILDLNLPDLNGLEVQERIAARGAGMPIIFVTAYGDVPATVRAMKAGAVEFLTKPLHEDLLLKAVEEAIRYSHVALAEELETRMIRDRYTLLSPRERQVMDLVVSGLLNKQVGGVLGISEITVKAHRARVMHKMNAGSLAELVKFVARLRRQDARAGGA